MPFSTRLFTLFLVFGIVVGTSVTEFGQWSIHEKLHAVVGVVLRKCSFCIRRHDLNVLVGRKAPNICVCPVVPFFNHDQVKYQ